jgi:ATP-binding cassette subfamily B protein
MRARRLRQPRSPADRQLAELWQAIARVEHNLHELRVLDRLEEEPPEAPPSPPAGEPDERGAAQADAATPVPAESRPEVRVWRRLFAQSRPYWGHLLALLLISFVATPLALLAPLAVKIVVDSVIGPHELPGFLDALIPGGAVGSDSARLTVAFVLVLAVAFLTQVQRITADLLSTFTGERLLLAFRAKLVRHLQRLSIMHHDRKGTADAVYRVQYDANSVQYIAVYGFIPLLTSAFMLVGMVYVTARVDLQLALFALGIAPILFFLTQVYRRRLRTRWHEAKRLDSSALGVLQEVLTGLRVVKAFGQEDRESQRFFDPARGAMRARLKVALLQGSFTLAIGMTIAGGTAGVLYVGVRHVQEGALTLGSLLLVMAYLGQLYEPLRAISGSIVTLQSYVASAERAFAVLDEAADVPERPDARPLRRATGVVEFQNVSFAYTPERPVLRDVSFELEPGTRLGIAGSSGSGKTSLVSLLMRFYDPTSGRILLDGVDLRDYRVADVRSQFAIVLQEPVLFSTTIAENIAYAKPNASMDEIVAAAKAAHVHEFVLALPDGYGTQVGERGMSLSGGERQRVSLARAFLKDAPILILDEPTSSVDIISEAVIIEAMAELMKGRTTLMIAHRGSTLETCDTRIEIQEGRLVSLRQAAPGRLLA